MNVSDHVREVPIWHVVWTTWGSRLDWRVLQTELASGAASHDSSASATPHQTESSSALTLDQAACRQIENDIRAMTATGGDRIAGDTQVFAVTAWVSQVQIVLQCEESRLQQVVGRLKSRTATLLSFDPAYCTPGKQTWARGFGRIRCPDQDAVRNAIDIVETFGVRR
jgi:hypothetical protein